MMPSPQPWLQHDPSPHLSHHLHTAPTSPCPYLQGVVKALFEQRLLPRVLAGSSVGSIVAAIIATKTDEQLHALFSQLDQLDISFFSSSSMWELLYSLVRKGHLQVRPAAGPRPPSPSCTCARQAPRAA